MNTVADTQHPAKQRGRPSRQQEEQVRRRRRSDMSIGRLGRLSVDESKKDPKYVYRWVNDDEGRMQQLHAQDWDPVSKTEFNLDSEHEVGTGDNIERVATGSTKAILCKKRKEWYEADKAVEQKAIDELEESMKRGEPTSPDGLSGPTAYIPEGTNIQIGRQ